MPKAKLNNKSKVASGISLIIHYLRKNDNILRAHLSKGMDCFGSLVPRNDTPSLSPLLRGSWWGWYVGFACLFVPN